jgi:DNA polymerase V
MTASSPGAMGSKTLQLSVKLTDTHQPRLRAATKCHRAQVQRLMANSEALVSRPVVHDLPTSSLRQHDRQHGINFTVPQVRPTADTAFLVIAAVVCAQFWPGFNYAKAGAVVSDLRPLGQEQGDLDLFTGLEAETAVPAEAARAKLMTAVNTLNHRFGRDSVRLGSTAAASSIAEIRVWATKQERRSPRYTTRWDEMPVVKA